MHFGQLWIATHALLEMLEYRMEISDVTITTNHNIGMQVSQNQSISERDSCPCVDLKQLVD